MRFLQSILSSALVLMLLAGCTANRTATVTPTTTVIPPTVTATKPSATLDVRPKPGAPGLGDSLYPGLGNSGYDVQHYSLDLTVNDVATSNLNGKATIDAKTTQSLSSFNLDFVGFDITGISVNGQPATFKRSQQELTITPSTPLAADESFMVEVQYQGSPGETDSAALPLHIGWVRYQGGSYVLSEPDGAETFYPVNNHPLDKASYTFRVTVPKPYEVAVNGILTDTIDQGKSTTFVFEERNPMASYLATVDIDQFDTETYTAENGTPIRNYYSTELPEDIRKLFDQQDEMLVYYSDVFGPYPFDVYGALVVQTRLGAALETQTMSLFGMDMMDASQPEGSQEVIAHELAHQWFGDSVSLADWRDIWLNESFATYAEGLWIEHTQGRQALDQWIRNVYSFVRQHRQDMSPPGEPPANDLFNPGVYYWGALGLHALRLEVGDEAFFQILKTYQERYKGGNARTADFIAVAEEVSGKDLNSFFDSWLYSEEVAPIPALSLKSK